MALDLFYQGSFEESVKSLKRDIIKLAANEFGVKMTANSFYIAWGNKEDIGNNVLFVSDPISKHQKFNATDDKKLLEIASEYKIGKLFLTRSHLIPLDKYQRDQIKTFSLWIHKVIDILQPKLIVVLGEKSAYTFFKRKILINDFHGTIIGEHENIPLIYTHPVLYYTERSPVEDISYKEFIKKNDWELIQKEYEARIC